jgi:predicted ester cyclase
LRRREKASLSPVSVQVVTRWTSRGTHQGEFEGIAPTGKQVTVAEVAIFRITEGKIAEQWGFPDVMALLRQVGVKPNKLAE